MKKVSHLGYYALYREVDGRHFVGHIHGMIGAMTKEITPEEASNLRVVDDNEWTGWKPEQIKSFENATLKNLILLLD